MSSLSRLLILHLYTKMMYIYTILFIGVKLYVIAKEKVLAFWLAYSFR